MESDSEVRWQLKSLLEIVNRSRVSRGREMYCINDRHHSLLRLLNLPEKLRSSIRGRPHDCSNANSGVVSLVFE
jgi:hypothetical protein